MPTSMPVCRRIRAARGAMPASAMIAGGGPMTPSKHIQANQGRRRHEGQQERQRGGEQEAPDKEA